MVENQYWRQKPPLPFEPEAYSFGWLAVQFYRDVQRHWESVPTAASDQNDLGFLRLQFDELQRLSGVLGERCKATAAGGKHPADRFRICLQSAWSGYSTEVGGLLKMSPKTRRRILKAEQFRELFRTRPWVRLLPTVLRFCRSLPEFLANRVQLGLVLADIVYGCPFPWYDSPVRDDWGRIRKLSWLDKRMQELWDAFDGLGYVDSDCLVGFEHAQCQDNREYEVPALASEVDSRLRRVFGLDRPAKSQELDAGTQPQVEVPLLEDAAEGGGGQSTGGPEKNRRKNINARMLETIQLNPEAIGWNSPQWAAYLKCSRSAVVATKTWQDLKIVQERQRAEKARDRRRRPKGSDVNKARGGDAG